MIIINNVFIHINFQIKKIIKIYNRHMQKKFLYFFENLTIFQMRFFFIFLISIL